MCDSREFCRSSRGSTMGINFDALGDVEHFEHLSGDMLDLCRSKEYTDVTFVVNGIRFPAHKVVLAARCTYFRILLYGDMKEARLGPEEEIPFADTTPEAFRLLLEYIYSGKICLGDINEESMLHLLGLTNKYDFGLLQQAIITYMKATLNESNVCVIYNVASFYQLKELSEACSNFVDLHALEVMKADGFLSLSQTALMELIARDSFFAPEIEIFHGVKRWMSHSGMRKEDAQDLLKEIRLQLISQSCLLHEIRQCDLFNSDKILDALSVINQKSAMELDYRGLLLPEENVATPHRGACTVEGQAKEALLNGDIENYNGENGYTTHTITRDRSKGITVQLNQPYIVNCINMLLWDKDNRSYSYLILVSLDKKEWIIVVDRSAYLCRSWQELFFPKMVVRYIRIIGVNNTMNRSFHLVSFSCYYTNKLFQLGEDNLIMPSENVASISASATVLDGVSRSRNALLNGNTRDYDWDSGYTCHQLGSGNIMIQLTQPYVISSMRLLLWDCDDRTYSYYIEVSCDQKSWIKVSDKTKERCHSWQLITFSPMPITFIKLVGTHNTANEVFHVVHFECPASTSLKQSLP